MNLRIWMITLACVLLGTWGCGKDDSSDGMVVDVMDAGMGGDVSSSAALESLTLSADRQTLTVGETIQLSVQGVSSDGSMSDVTADVTWQLSAEGVVRFNAETVGELEAITAGTVDVVAELSGISSPALSLTIEAAAPSGELTVTPSTVNALPGEEVQLTATYVEGETTTDVTADVNWSTSDEAIVTIENGIARILGAGNATIEGRYLETTVSVSVVGIACDYPSNNGTIAFGEVFPDMLWPDAYAPDGSRGPFSLSQFHCSPKYEDRNTLIIVLGAGWCGPCSNMTQNILNPQAEGLVENGAEILYLEAQDTNYELASSRFAYRHIGDLIAEGPGIRVGELETHVRDQAGDWMLSPGYVQQQPIVTGFPSVWVLRRSDMRMIADQGRSNFYLPFELIVADPDADWSDPPPPPFRSNCEEGDEELSEPNNTAQEAVRVEPGTFEGGICDENPDFYRFAISGPWRATLEFDGAEADLDMLVYDKRSESPVLDENGRALLSNGTGSVEQLEHEGAAIIMIYGYNRTSTSYTLTIEAL
ncbi:MAG: hypothetical protein ACON3Z_00460 [Bradymonadia bacterium]